jgi:hypothetical protein
MSGEAALVGARYPLNCDVHTAIRYVRCTSTQAVRCAQTAVITPTNGSNRRNEAFAKQDPTSIC